VSPPSAAELLARIAAEVKVPIPAVAAVVRLMDEGATVPFIARYRKEATGGLDEVQIRTIGETAVWKNHVRQWSSWDSVRCQRAIRISGRHPAYLAPSRRLSSRHPHRTACAR
jgi:hypothetical protein